MGKYVYLVSGGCTLCGMCLYECPSQAIVMQKTGAFVNVNKCIGCGRCARNCASEAIKKVEHSRMEAQF